MGNSDRRKPRVKGRQKEKSRECFGSIKEGFDELVEYPVSSQLQEVMELLEQF